MVTGNDNDTKSTGRITNNESNDKSNIIKESIKKQRNVKNQKSRARGSNKKSNQSINNKDKESTNSNGSRIQELTLLEHKLLKTSQFKLINTNNRGKTYRIHISKTDQFRLYIPYDKSNLIKLKTNDLENDGDDLDKITKNVISNFNQLVKKLLSKRTNSNNNNNDDDTTIENTNDETYTCLFFVNYLINGLDWLKLDSRQFQEHEKVKLKIV